MSLGSGSWPREDPSSGAPEALRRELERLVALAARDRGLLDAVLNHSPSGVIVCDATGRITLLNRAAERIWGGSATVENKADWTRYRAFHPDGRPFAPDDWSLARVLATGEPVDPEEIEIERFDGLRAMIVASAAPILGGGHEVVGALGVFADVTGFKQRERELLDRERRAGARLARLQALTAGLSEAITPADVARAALEHVAAALGVRGAGLWMRSAAGGAELVHEIGFAPESRARFARIAAGDRAPVADVLRDSEPVWIRSRAELVGRYPGIVSAEGVEIAVACLPMTVKGQCIGAMSLHFEAEFPFAPEDRSFLLVATRHAAQALERARLYEAERTARSEAVAVGERTTFLYEASALLASSLEYEATLTSVAKLAVPRVADWCSVELAQDLALGKGPVIVAHRDPAKIELARELGRRYPPDPNAPTGSPNVVRTGRSELYAEIPDALLVAGTHDAEHLRLARALGLCSAIIAPMKARGKTLGAISFFSAESGRRYGAADLEMAEHLARRAGLAIDNARLYEQAQEAVRAREEVVAIVAHDLKNPLNAILMGAGLLRRSDGDPTRVRHHADAIERSVHRMRSLVRDLLDLSRLEAGRFTLERQPHALAPLVAEALSLVQAQAQEKGLTLRAETGAAGDVRVLCDRERVLQVFSNLLGNAVAFTPAGGRVTVQAHASGADVVLSVADTGPGIAHDEQRMIFERFWKSRSSRHGTGLGLSIAKGMVEAHGGRIWVESRPGEGAVFLFTLPVV